MFGTEDNSFADEGMGLSADARRSKNDSDTVFITEDLDVANHSGNNSNSNIANNLPFFYTSPFNGISGNESSNKKPSPYFLPFSSSLDFIDVPSTNGDSQFLAQTPPLSLTTFDRSDFLVFPSSSSSSSSSNIGIPHQPLTLFSSSHDSDDPNNTFGLSFTSGLNPFASSFQPQEQMDNVALHASPDEIASDTRSHSLEPINESTTCAPVETAMDFQAFQPQPLQPSHVITEHATLPAQHEDEQHEMQQQPPAELSHEQQLREYVRDYLRDKSNESFIIISAPLVVQKSYGTEKRFLCPPPYCVIGGRIWYNFAGVDDNVDRDNSDMVPCQFFISMKDDNAAETKKKASTSKKSRSTTALTRANVIRATTSLNTEADLKIIPSPPQPTILKSVFKNLYVNEGDRSRLSRMFVQAINSEGLEIGSFPSEILHTVSKPSKKKNTGKARELCILSGSTVAMFNRIRSQANSTKYLKTDATKYKFAPSIDSWDHFIIQILNPVAMPEADSESMVSPPRSPGAQATTSDPQSQMGAFHVDSNEPLSLHYGDEIVLKCVRTGLTSNVLIVRKVEERVNVLINDNRHSYRQTSNLTKTSLNTLLYSGTAVSLSNSVRRPNVSLEDSGAEPEPVFQLNRVAFQIKDTDRFFSVNGEKVFVSSTSHSSSSSRKARKDPFYYEVSEESVWTIVGTGQAEYRFYTPSNVPRFDLFPIKSIPLVFSIALTDRAKIALYGKNFDNSLTVFFGDAQAHTNVSSKQLMTANVPEDIIHQANQFRAARAGTIDGMELQVPIFLVHESGIIFPTRSLFSC